MALKSAVINVMEAAARKAARGLLHDFGEVEQLQVSRKGPADFVSTADFKAEKTLRRELEKARPQDITGILNTTAMSLIRNVGGASGPLYGTCPSTPSGTSLRASEISCWK